MDQKRFQECRSQLMERIEVTRDLSDAEIYAIIDELIEESDPRRRMRLSDRWEMRKELFNSVRRLDVLQNFIDDDSVTEIMVNGLQSIFIERSGRLFRCPEHFSSQEKLQDVIQRIVALSNRVANEAVPIVDARLENGARVNIVMNPVSVDGPAITIRRFPDHPISMQQLVEWGSVSREAVDYLKKLVKAGYNIFISGGTGSGKTTFLNALSNFIPKDERIITVEDNAELQIQGVRNLVRLEARRPNAEGGGEVTIRDLIRASLRMRPSRIIVGEVRGAETIDMLQSLNTGQLVWAQDTLDDTNDTPVLSAENGHLYLYISTSFHIGWRSNTTAPIPIWKIDAETGEIIWKREYDCYSQKGVSGGVQSTIAVGRSSLDDNIYVTVAMTGTPSGGVLACLDKKTGEVKWEHKAFYAWSSPVCVYNEDGTGYVIYASCGGRMYLLDGKTGAQFTQFELSEGAIEASPAVYNNYVIIGTRSSKIWGLKLH
jgi:pilus assembly protein CpaF